jgi:glyoxylase-like metal-dependent hydrolase (beta-lactamase superfamily II)
MYFEQFYLGCLAHASYLLASEGDAVVVDPQRDVDLYLKAAGEHGLTIRHIFESHLHADFVSGHRELAARTGAKIYMGAQAGATFPHIPVSDGFELKVGSASIRVLETPGHTPESICLVVTDTEKSPAPWGVLTGDTLFIAAPHANATGRPAVRQSARKVACTTRQHARLSGARSWLALRKEYASGALLHHWHGAADELRATDHEQGRLHCAVDQQPAGASRILSQRCGD